MKNLPQKILAVLIIFLLFLVGFTYYIQKPIPSFKRLVSKNIVLDLQDIKLDRYDTKHHPVLFKLTPKEGKSKKLFSDLANECKAQKIDANKVPDDINKVDKKLVKIVKNSEQIFLSKQNSKKFCLLFRQNGEIFLYTNDKF